MAERTVKIPNISCGHCVMTIEREVAELSGVQSVKADQAARAVTVSWDEEATSWQAVEGLLREINYPPAE
ncbi:MAG: heavy-metal-associated domain-containing protein [Gemmatimonadales bacterium]|jgi:copper chaperone CopZ|nr:MAG: heavy-metal-associated domain-containing protein [Gemmatimonadales bacterium]